MSIHRDKAHMWLEALPERFRMRALCNHDQQRDFVLDADDRATSPLAAALYVAFSWSSTHEGYDWWAAAYRWAGGDPAIGLGTLSPGKMRKIGTPHRRADPPPLADVLAGLPNGLGPVALIRVSRTVIDLSEPSTLVDAVHSVIDAGGSQPLWKEVLRWASGTPGAGCPTPAVPTHPELGEVEVIHWGETYATVKTSDGSTRFVRSDEIKTN